MEKLFLVTPALKHEEAFKDMIKEWDESKGRIYPGVIRPKGIDYISWLKVLESYRKRETCPSHLVPSDTFFLVNEYGRIFGAISIRHHLNEHLIKFEGHIGYGVRPSERRKGYATLMLKMALKKCRAMGINSVLITCNKGNTASAKTIIANGGVFENELPEEDGNLVERYWIHL